MPQGLSTRAVGAPTGTAGRFAPPGGVMRIVPLSAFFLDADDEAIEPGALTGFRRKKKSSDARTGERTGEQPRAGEKNTKNKNPSKDSTQMTGGNAAAADTAVHGRQSTASSGKQESATMATGTPLISPGGATRSASFPGGASKLGATRASTGATSSGNVAQYPVPIGEPIRRGKRQRKKQESRDRWIERLGKMAL